MSRNDIASDICYPDGPEDDEPMTPRKELSAVIWHAIEYGYERSCSEAPISMDDAFELADRRLPLIESAVNSEVHALRERLNDIHREWESACEREKAAHHLREQAEERAAWYKREHDTVCDTLRAALADSEIGNRSGLIHELAAEAIRTYNAHANEEILSLSQRLQAAYHEASEMGAAVEEWKAKYVATVTAWEESKKARDRSDKLLQQCLDELRQSR